MYKKYIVRLTDCERQLLNEVVRKLKGTSEKVRRAQILLKADADGPHWQDAPIAEAFDCRVRTIENVRQRFVLEGLDSALERAKRQTPPTPKLLDGEQEAQIIAMPPVGSANGTLRWLAEKVGERRMTPTISYETIRDTLKKMG